MTLRRGRYDRVIPVAKAEKVAITLDGDLLAEAERVRARTAESRSALIARALRQLLKEEARQEKVRRYVEALRESPEDSEHVSAAAALAEESLRHVPWDDE